MPFKVIVICVEDSLALTACVETASRLAIQNHSHVVSAIVAEVTTTDAGSSTSSTLRDRFESMAQDVRLASYEMKRMDGDAATGVSKLGKCSDLVIVGSQGPNPGAKRTDFLEYVVLNSGSPVLVVPTCARQSDSWDSVLVAWDNGMPAARALRSSMPILHRAGRVDLVHFRSPIEPHETRGENMSDVVDYLHWHGIKANPLYRSSDGNVGRELIEAANELSDKLIVMGCVAHPRYPGVRLGGATGSILESAQIPVLMSR